MLCTANCDTQYRNTNPYASNQALGGYVATNTQSPCRSRALCGKQLL